MTTAKNLIERLAIIDENIVNEAGQMPKLFIDAARYRVGKMRLRSQSVAQFEYLRSKIALQIRARKDGTGERMTEGGIKERIEINPKIIELRAQYEDSYAQEELSKLILEAIRIRKDAIKVIFESQMLEGKSEANQMERLAQRRKLRKDAMNLDSIRRRVERVEADD